MISWQWWKCRGNKVKKAEAKIRQYITICYVSMEGRMSNPYDNEEPRSDSNVSAILEHCYKCDIVCINGLIASIEQKTVWRRFLCENHPWFWVIDILSYNGHTSINSGDGQKYLLTVESYFILNYKKDRMHIKQ